jgi:hypothetical protein
MASLDQTLDYFINPKTKHQTNKKYLAISMQNGGLIPKNEFWFLTLG